MEERDIDFLGNDGDDPMGPDSGSYLKMAGGKNDKRKMNNRQKKLGTLIKALATVR